MSSRYLIYITLLNLMQQLRDISTIIIFILQRRIRLVSKVPKTTQLKGARPGCPARSVYPKAPVPSPIAILPPKEGKAGSDLQEGEGRSGASLPLSLVITEGQMDTAVLAAANSSLSFLRFFLYSSVVVETKTCSNSIS